MTRHARAAIIAAGLLVSVAHAQDSCGDFLFPLYGAVNLRGPGAPTGMLIVDFDGQGPKLVACQSYATRVYSWNGSQLVQEQSAESEEFANFFAPVDLTAGDFDGDGDLDFMHITPKSNASVISIGYIRNDDGVLVVSTAFSGTINTNDIDAGDLNGDGIADAAITSGNPKQVRLYRGVLGGNPVFQVALSLTELPRGVALTDFDGDGDLDVLASCQQFVTGAPGFVTPFRNNGNWSFTALANVPMTFDNTEIRAANLNGDARGDAVVMGGGPSVRGFAILTGNGTSVSVERMVTTDYGPAAFRISDVDDDGDDDIVASIGNVLPSDIHVFHNNGSAVFVDTLVGSAPVPTHYLAIGDLDHNGLPDLAVSDPNLFGWYAVTPGRPGGTFALNDIVPLPTYASDLAVGDIDGDCDDDVVVSAQNGALLSVHRCDGEGGFETTQQVSGTEPMGRVAPLLVDVNGNDARDLLVVRKALNRVELRLNNGTGTFGAVTNITVPSAIGPMVAGDLDGDGDQDVAVVSTSANTVQLLSNQGGSFTVAALATSTIPTQDIHLGDVDGDGDLDLVTLANSTVRIWLNDGTGAFSAPTDVASGSSPNFVLDDCDGDGDLDVAIQSGAGFGSTIRLYFNGGAGTFAPFVSVPAITGYSRVHARDVDGDGIADLLICGSGNSPGCLVWRSLGGGNFDTNGSTMTESMDGRLGFGHFTMDGRLDLMAMPTGKWALMLIRNLLCPPETIVGDVNHDLKVDGCDLGIVLGLWGTSGGADGFADINGDGTVDGADLALVLGAWTSPGH